MSENINKEELKENIINEIKQIFDPEIPVDIYSLGLIYDIDIKPDMKVDVTMTLTAPNCPAAGILPGQVAHRVTRVKGVRAVDVNLTFDPPWTQDMLSEEARFELDLD